MFEEILDRAANPIHLSLEDIALSKVTVILCKQPELKALIQDVDYHKMIFKTSPYAEQNDWKLVRLKAAEIMSRVCLPEKLRRRVLDSVWQISLEISKWIDYHTKNSYLGIQTPDDFCWTPHRKIDYRRTAKAVIRDETIDIKKRYKLACLYCLEDDIRNLWGLFRITTKKAFHDGRDPKKVEQHCLVVYWSYFIQEMPLDHYVFEQHEELTHVYAFRCAALEGNKIATEYFFKKLTYAEKKSVIVPCIEYIATQRRSLPTLSTAHSAQQTYIKFPEEDFNDSVYFLFSQLDDEDRIKVFENKALVVLKSFLSWPRQRVFMELVNLTWQYLPKKDIENVLREIFMKDLYEYKDYNYRKLFLEFWDTCPPSYKLFLCNEESFGGFLIILLIGHKIPFVRRKKTFRRKVMFIKSILKGRTTKEKILEDDEKWEFLKFIIQEGIVTRTSMTKFQPQFLLHIAELYSAQKKKWDQYFKLIHMILPAEDTRK